MYFLKFSSLLLLCTSFSFTSSLPWQILKDIQLQLSYLEKVERSTCGAKARCVRALREAQCVLLEGELDVIQDMITFLQQPSSTKLINTTSFLTSGKVRFY
jgi:hypothetical protein